MTPPITHFSGQSGIISVPGSSNCLDTEQLSRLEQSFQEWVEASRRPDIRVFRKRIWIIFLLIR